LTCEEAWEHEWIKDLNIKQILKKRGLQLTNLSMPKTINPEEKKTENQLKSATLANNMLKSG